MFPSVLFANQADLRIWLAAIASPRALCGDVVRLMIWIGLIGPSACFIFWAARLAPLIVLILVPSCPSHVSGLRLRLANDRTQLFLHLWIRMCFFGCVRGWQFSNGPAPASSTALFSSSWVDRLPAGFQHRSVTSALTGLDLPEDK